MVSGLLCLAAAFLAPTATPIIEPVGTVAWLSTSTTSEPGDVLFDTLKARLETMTRLSVVRAEDSGVDVDAVRRCGGSFACWAETIPDAPSGPRLVIVSTRLPLGPDRHRLLCALFDPELAAIAKAAASDGSNRLEELVFDDAVSVAAVEVPSASPASLDDGVDRVVSAWAGALAKAGYWRPTGSIEVDRSSRLGGDWMFSLDGTPLEGGSETIRLPRVLPGAYELAVRHRDHYFRPEIQPLTVTTATVVQLSLSVPEATKISRQLRLGFRWVGVAAIIAGASLLAHSVYQSTRPRMLELCDQSDGACDSSRFARVGPVLEAPLGYSLLGAGALWAAGSYVDGEPHEAPILSIVAGLLVGSVSYALSAAIE